MSLGVASFTFELKSSASSLYTEFSSLLYFLFKNTS